MTRFDQIEQASLTDVGVRRSHNQDNLAVRPANDDQQWREQGHLYVVADGMGGHAVGEKASELAKQTIPHTFTKYSQEGPAHALRKAFQEANAQINRCGEQNQEFRGMGTTSTALVIRGREAWLGHVGDSRAYRIRDGLIEQLTYDHSYVWEYARLKHIDPADVQDFPSNVIHRCLGPQPLVQVDVEGPHPVKDGDVYLLCSDGLSGQVNDNEMGVVASLLPPEEACRFLVDLANLRGGPDNVTVIVVRVGGKGGSGLTPTTPRRPLLSRVPWPLLALFGGILLAAGAIALQIFQIDDVPPLILFLLALVPIVAGLIGLVMHQRTQKSRLIHLHERGEPRAYRSAPCTVDRPLVDKLAAATRSLKQRLEERHWDPDLETYTKHERRAEEALRQGDLAEAFREFCRAMRPLNESLQRHRQKEEVFQPVWDKSPR